MCILFIDKHTSFARAIHLFFMLGMIYAIVNMHILPAGAEDLEPQPGTSHKVQEGGGVVLCCAKRYNR